MSKVTTGWVMAALAGAGLGLTFVSGPAGVALAVVGAMGALMTTYMLNVPGTRAASWIADGLAAGALWMATGNPFLAAALVAMMVMLITHEAVLRNQRDLQDFGPLIGMLAAVVLVGLAWPTLPSKLWLGALALPLAMGALIAFKCLDGRKDYLSKLTQTAINIGKPLPVAVELPSRDGTDTFSLAKHIGQFVLLVFIRGDWCPVCHVMLRIVSKERETLAKHGVRVAIISPTEGQMADEAVARLGLDPGMLYDEDSKLARSLALIQKSKNEGKEVPMPVTILIDREGKVRHLSKPDDVTAYSSEKKVIAILEAAPA